MAKRSGSTIKISVSVDKEDLRVLRRYATAAHGGNVSAALSDAIEMLRRRDAGERLLGMLGDVALTATRAAEIDAEQAGAALVVKSRPKRKSGRARRAA